jgi:hypothetical protein
MRIRGGMKYGDEMNPLAKSGDQKNDKRRLRGL